MQRYFASAVIIVLILLVVSRALIMKKKGIKAMRFGEMDKKDFLIPPFAFFYFYLVAASAFNLPKLGAELFRNDVISWVGVVYVFWHFRFSCSV